MASETLPPERSFATSPLGSRLQWIIPLALAIVLLYIARAIIPPFIIAIVLAYLLDPFVAAVHRATRAPRVLVVVVMALLTLAVFGILITLLVRLAASQGQQFIHHLPGYVISAVNNINKLIAPTTVQIPQSAIPGLGGNLPNISIGDILSVAASFAASTGQSLLDFLLTFVSTIYLLIDGHHLANGLQRFFPLEQRPRLGIVMKKVRHTWNSYIRAQLLLAALMAVVSWLILEPLFGLLGLLVPGLFGGALPFALPVAIAVGLLETVPIVGPLVAIALAAIVALATLGILPALMVVAALYLIRLIEDNVVVPNVLGHAIHLPAVVTLFAVAVGGLVGGLLGLLLAVPLAAAIRVFIDEYYPHPHPALAIVTTGSADQASAPQPAGAIKHTPAVQLAAPTNPAPVAVTATGVGESAPPSEAPAANTRPNQRGKRKSAPPSR